MYSLIHKKLWAITVTLLLVAALLSNCHRDLQAPIELSATRTAVLKSAAAKGVTEAPSNACTLARLEARANYDIEKADLRRRDLEETGIRYNDILNWVSIGFLGIGVGAGIAAALEASKATIGALGVVGPTGLFATETNKLKAGLGDELPKVYEELTKIISELGGAIQKANDEFSRDPKNVKALIDFRESIEKLEGRFAAAEGRLFNLMVQNPGLHFPSRLSGVTAKPREPACPSS